MWNLIANVYISYRSNMKTSEFTKETLVLYKSPVENQETMENRSGSRNFGGGGLINMKYKPLHSAAIFFWPTFTRQGDGGAWPPCAPPPPGFATGKGGA